MLKSLLMAAAVVAITAGAAQADDHKTLVAPAATATPAEAAASAATEAAADAAATVKQVMLKDGTKVEIKGSDVFVVDAHGAKTAAPDGVHELADGTKVTTKAGKIVK